MAIIADKIQIRIGGDLMKNYVFSSFRLTQEVGKPNEFHFRMWKKTLQEDDTEITFSLSKKLMGQKLEFALTTTRRDHTRNHVAEVLEFEGIIFDACVVRSNMGAGQELEVTAYSPDYLLYDSPHCCSFEEQTLKSIVSSVMSPYNIPIINQPANTDEILYTVQYNETSYDFLLRLARRFGNWSYWNGLKFIWGKVEKAPRVTLHSQADILNYKYHLQMKHTNFSHASHNYKDYQNNKAEGSSFSGGSVANMMTDNVYNSSKSAFSKKTYHDLLSSNAEDNPLDEPTAAAKAQALGRKAGMAICRGTTNRADLKIGSIISIKESYETTPGEFRYCTHDDLLIYRIEHEATANGFYENTFAAIPATSEYPPYDDADQYPRAIAQRAVVKDNKDPEKLGRVRVQFHWQEEQDSSQMTPWIRIAQPHGGGNKGFYFIPEEGEEVMVSFENGNAEKPYVSGTLYHGQAKPPDTWYDDADNIKAIRTRSGHTIEFHDTEGEEFIKIYDNEKDNFVLTFSTHEQLIKLESANNIELYAKNDIIMEAGNNINIKATKDINREAGENTTEKAGKNISETAGDNIRVEAGKNISESAGDSASMDAGKNISLSADDNINSSAGKNTTISADDNVKITASKDMKIAASDHMNTTVGKTMKVDISENLFAKISKKFNFDANTIEQVAGKSFKIKAGSKLDQSASNGIKIDGGSKMDIKAGNVKIN